MGYSNDLRVRVIQVVEGGAAARAAARQFVIGDSTAIRWAKRWRETVLAPTLKPGDVVVLDNLSAHKVPGIREAIEAAGATLLYLPPYSPDFNPIEQLFAKLKALLRKAAERSLESLWNRIACLLDAFQPDEYANYFRNSGYAAS